MRYFFIIFALLCVSLLFLYGKLRISDDKLPVFLVEDKIATKHKTGITVKVNSIVKPSEQQLETLKNDYSNIWAHLNHLYATNDVEAGKEYYTQEWFKVICRHNTPVKNSKLWRSDVAHQISIRNWATDGLLCTISDSVNIVSHFASNRKDTALVSLSAVLLYEGDHWRIDALNIENRRNTNFEK